MTAPSMDDQLKGYLEAARTRDAALNVNGEHVFGRDDDVVLADYLSRELDRHDRPAVFSAGGFWVYDDVSGAWGSTRRVEVTRMVMSLSGMKVFVKTDPATSEPITKKLNMSGGRVKAVADLVEHNLNQQDHFNAAPAGLAFKNGFLTVDKSGLKLIDKSPDNRARSAFSFAWRDDSECPRWKQFLQDVFRDDDDQEQKTALLQEWLGIALLGAATTYDRALILYGQGANGKSVFMDVIQRLFPEESVSAIAPQHLSEEYYRARLDGVLLNIVSEMPKSDIVNTPAFNGIVSGDKVQARKPYGVPFEFRARAGHCFSVNPPLPAVSDLARGFWRRWVIVSFNRSFERDAERREKRTFTDELAAERRGIVRWAVEGAVRVCARGEYTELPSSEDMLADWRISADQVAQFVRDRLDTTKARSEMMTAEDLWPAYRMWSENTGHRPMAAGKFAERLTGLGHLPIQEGHFTLRPLTLRSTTRPSHQPTSEYVDDDDGGYH